jgi:UDP-2,4-diacetamido-2,4,6-trideoxy-beta-L-altropyranose hydrolase
MKKKILFRADGNANTGLGHLFRLFALVEMYKGDFDYIYLTKASSVREVIPKEYNVKIIPEKIDYHQEPKWLQGEFPPSEYMIIADGYQFDSSYQKRIKSFGYFLMYVDDLTTEYMYADIVVNHSPHVKPVDFNSEPYTKLALGTKYAILRPGFIEASRNKRQINSIDSAFVCFGGADMYNLSFLAVQALLKIESFKEINVVLGGANTHDEIYSLARKFQNVNVYRNLNERQLIDVMQKCNFAIAPASTILYELCSIKMPVLSGYFVDNQELIYKGFVDSNSIFKGGDFLSYSEKDFIHKINEIIETGNFTEMCNHQGTIISRGIRGNFINLLAQK